MENTHKTEPLLNRKEAAEYLGIKEHTLSVWASEHRYDLPYVKVGRLVKYRLSDLAAFVARNTRQKGGQHE
ncbi:MAG: helix-turn-helix domain-containing protein [Alphaproteobacteria bacterium]|nr:helix-turn-helix domain-containing protein [Alphaproteobacteria bacterium]